MPRVGGVTLAALFAVLVVTLGCLGIGDPDPQVGEPPTNAPEGTAPTPGPSTDSSLPEVGPTSLTLQVALTEGSSPPLELSDVRFDPALPGEVRVLEPEVRAVAGETVTVARWSTDGPLELSDGRLNVTAFDGLGKVTVPLEVRPGTLAEPTTVTVTLATNGPGEVDIVQVDGSKLVEPAEPHAVPTYGYLIWPDGSRERLPGFDHAVHVPAGYPNLPPGEEARFLVEAPPGAEVLWRLDEREPRRGVEFAFTPEPGRHHVRLSVGPGESSTSLSVHSDLALEENGTIAAGTPTGPTIEPANGARVPFNVTDGAFHLSAVLTPVEPEHRLEDLDLILVDEHGRTLAKSETANQTQEGISWPDPRPGSYEIRIESDQGAAQDYSLRVRVNY